MPIEGREKGIRSPFAVRFGITAPTYLGVNTQKPALALLDGEGVEGVNLRIKGGRPISRGGQEKVNVDTIQPIHGFTDTTSDAGINPNPDLNTDIGTPYNALYAIGNDASGVNGSFVHVDRASLVVVTTGIHDAGRPSSVPIEWNGGVVAAISFDETDSEIVSVPSLTTIVSIPRVGSIATCTSLLAMGSDLLAVWDDVGATVGLWDGSNLTTDLTVANGFGGSLAKFQGTAYAGFRPEIEPINSIYKRRPGAGSWVALALPDATLFRLHHMLSYRGRLYAIGEDSGDFVIYSTDGNTFVLERTIAVAASSPAVAQFAVVRGSLYYWYHDGGDGSDFSLIGKFNGASWDDDNKNLGSLISGSNYTRGLGFVGGHDGADAVYADASGNVHVWESDGINIFGTWAKVLTNAAGVYGGGSGTPPVRVSGVSS